MNSSVTLFISMVTTLLAIINPLLAIPVFLGLMAGKDSEEQNRRQGCQSYLGVAGGMIKAWLRTALIRRVTNP
jgi:small neutral amino acid transporter SnatA (MarC family)